MGHTAYSINNDEFFILIDDHSPDTSSVTSRISFREKEVNNEVEAIDSFERLNSEGVFRHNGGGSTEFLACRLSRKLALSMKFRIGFSGLILLHPRT